MLALVIAPVITAPLRLSTAPTPPRASESFSFSAAGAVESFPAVICPSSGAAAGWAESGEKAPLPLKHLAVALPLQTSSSRSLQLELQQAVLAPTQLSTMTLGSLVKFLTLARSRLMASPVQIAFWTDSGSPLIFSVGTNATSMSPSLLYLVPLYSRAYWVESAAVMGRRRVSKT